ncbi:hypothetical protein CVIRNUC_003386 [Coccomyxa viridis]|uniref:Calcineurin-like phosphoesterase domain-containing protein n=1 Tax=Coccomyxa viridis TaxID=1274662 RepID=A0AAV1HYJ6_9CHLO|nr:hypothetical protein CVIRNUC_003386 [Coccomyxa viridis]
MSPDETGLFPTPKRIVVIGDLHGDWASTLETYKLASLIALHGKRWVWCGSPGTVVVQLGDQIDRKSRDETGGDEDSEFRILKFHESLDSQARRTGSRVLSLLGNHCIQNVRAYLNPESGLAYVSPKGLAHFGGAVQRAQAFKPGNEWANYLAEHRFTVLKVGPFLFVHGGVTPKIVDKYTIPQINAMVREYLRGRLPWNANLQGLLESNDSLLWNRSLAGPRPNVQKLDHCLQKWNCKAVMIGHTPVEKISTPDGPCRNKIWRVDSGISRAISGGNAPISRCQALDITFLPQNKVRMIPLQAGCPEPVTISIARTPPMERQPSKKQAAVVKGQKS